MLWNEKGTFDDQAQLGIPERKTVQTLVAAEVNHTHTVLIALLCHFRTNIHPSFTTHPPGSVGTLWGNCEGPNPSCLFWLESETRFRRMPFSPTEPASNNKHVAEMRVFEEDSSHLQPSERRFARLA